MRAFVSVKGLYKNYGSVTALKDVNLDLDETGPVGLIGKNGADPVIHTQRRAEA